MSDASKPAAPVISLVPHSLQDIPACMESVLTALRAGEHGNVQSAACVFMRDDGSVTVFGWGRTDAVHTLGVLNLGIGFLQNNIAGR